MAAARAEFARLTLLLLLRTDTPLALTPAGESPSKVRFKGADGFDAVLDIAPTTGLPISLTYTVRMHGTEQLRTYVTTIDERRTIDGISLPVRMTTTALGKVFGKVSYRTINLNPGFTPADFTKAGQ